MKHKTPKLVEQSRIRKGPLGSSSDYGMNGAFNISYKRQVLFVISSDQKGWDHVSVSLAHRCPSWLEMKFIKELFFDDQETVVQFHPRKSEYINNNEFVLHMWRKHGHEYELPPKEFV